VDAQRLKFYQRDRRAEAPETESLPPAIATSVTAPVTASYQNIVANILEHTLRSFRADPPAPALFVAAITAAANTALAREATAPSLVLRLLTSPPAPPAARLRAVHVHAVVVGHRKVELLVPKDTL
jgi:hypothetical protein